MKKRPDWYNELKLEVGVSGLYILTAIGDKREELKSLAVMLSHCGIALTSEITQDGNTRITFKVNEDAFFDAVYRNAGRPKNLLKSQNWDIQNVKVSDIKQMRDSGMTHQQIIEKIGCPRATYYRALKDARESDRPDNLSFFL